MMMIVMRASVCSNDIKQLCSYSSFDSNKVKGKYDKHHTDEDEHQEDDGNHFALSCNYSVLLL